MSSTDRSEFHSVSLLKFIYRWRKHLIVISIVAAVVSAIASFIITPKYKSTVIIFPTLSNAVGRSLMEEFNGTQQHHLNFGEEEQVEQTMQILRSSKLRNKVNDRLNLMKHYGIDPQKPKAATYFQEEFDDAVRFKPTEYLSIRIDVLDKSPDTAALIANTVAEMLDSVKNEVIKDRAQAAFEIADKELKRLNEEIAMQEDSIDFFRAKGIYDHKGQVEALSREYGRALAMGNKGAAKEIEEKLEVFKQYGGAFISMRERLYISRERLGVIKAKHEQAVADINSSLPYKFTVDKATPAEKKSKPVRWLIVVLSTISTFIFAVVFLILQENFSKIKDQLN